MCGIAGVIGRSKNPKLSFQLLTKLFDGIESRGTDAAGFYGTQAGNNGVILYHKEPIKSSQLIQKDSWKEVQNFNPNLLILHARQQSTGVGDSSSNKNNHPFTSQNKHLGMVHNGRIYEYTYLKDRYSVKSDCDSEILLRIFETMRHKGKERAIKELPNKPEDVATGLFGIREIFSYIQSGAMAVALAEWKENSNRGLWLFHNKERPLWVMDAREDLGQIYFCSTPEIWIRAYESIPKAKSIFGGRHRKNIVEIPENDVWYLTVNDENPSVTMDKAVNAFRGYYRFRLDEEKNRSIDLEDEKKHSLWSGEETKVKVITGLGENDELKNQPYTSPAEHWKNTKRRHHGSKGGGRHVDTSSPKVQYHNNQPYYSDDYVPGNDDDNEMTIGDIYNHGSDILDANDVDGAENEMSEGFSELDLEAIEAQREIPVVTRAEKTNKVSNLQIVEPVSKYSFSELDAVASNIKHIVGQIVTAMYDNAQSKSLQPSDFEDGVDALNIIYEDLQETYRLVDKY